MNKKVVTDDFCERLLFVIISEHYNLHLINLACLFPIFCCYIYLQTHNAVSVFEHYKLTQIQMRCCIISIYIMHNFSEPAVAEVASST
jgi:hypothetical protein